MSDDKKSSEPEGEEDLPISDELIGEDMPCLRCSYNLRGLRPVGQCPECGASIAKTVAFVMERVMCPSCFGPNHPSAALCVHCKQPITGAGVAANYFRTMPSPGGMRKSAEEPEFDEYGPEAPSLAWPLICCGVGVVVLMIILTKLAEFWTEPASPLESDGNAMVGRIIKSALTFPFAVIGVLVAVLPVRSYLRAMGEYRTKLQAWQASAKEREGSLAKEDQESRVEE